MLLEWDSHGEAVVDLISITARNECEFKVIFFQNETFLRECDDFLRFCIGKSGI